MLRQKLNPLTKEHMNKKQTDYKSIVEKVRNEGHEFGAEGRTDSAARMGKQAVQVPKPPRGRNHEWVSHRAQFHWKNDVALRMDFGLDEGCLCEDLHFFA